MGDNRKVHNRNRRNAYGNLKLRQKKVENKAKPRNTDAEENRNLRAIQQASVARNENPRNMQEEPI
jgi:hypothetical protein